MVTLKGQIIKIQEIKKGEAGGYGTTFIASKDTKAAVVSLGYGDGVSHGWKEVLILGEKAKVLNYFMDGLLVDITSNDRVIELDEVVIIGTQKNNSIRLFDAGGELNSYPEEQIQRISERVDRLHLTGQKN